MVATKDSMKAVSKVGRLVYWKAVLKAYNLAGLMGPYWAVYLVA